MNKIYWMDKLYTDLTLIKYLYKETNPRETLEIEHCLATSQAIRRQYKALRSAKKVISKNKPSVSLKTVASVLEYSRTANWSKFF